MRWSRYFLSSVVGCSFLSGCWTGGAKLSQRMELDQNVARAQKPEMTAPVPVRPRTNFLDVIPDQPGDAVNGEVAARIRATVNGSPIFEEEVKTNAYQLEPALQRLPEPERSQKRRELYKEILEQIIDRELLIQDAENRLKKAGKGVMGKLQDAAEKEFDKRWVTSMKKGNNIKSDDELKAMLAQQGLSIELIRRQWIRQFIATEYQRNIVMAKLDKIGHEQLKEYYETHADEYKVDDSVEWLDMFISSANPKFKSSEDARLMADQIADKLRRGEDFLALAKEHDDGNTVKDGGVGIGKKRGEIQPPDCEEALFRMKDGDVGILDFRDGYHVFKLVRREYAGLKPFDIEAQKDIRNKLRASMYEREVKKLIVDLRRKAIIEYSRTPQ